MKCKSSSVNDGILCYTRNGSFSTFTCIENVKLNILRAIFYLRAHHTYHYHKYDDDLRHLIFLTYIDSLYLTVDRLSLTRKLLVKIRIRIGMSYVQNLSKNCNV